MVPAPCCPSTPEPREREDDDAIDLPGCHEERVGIGGGKEPLAAADISDDAVGDEVALKSR